MTDDSIETIDFTKPFEPLMSLIGREGSNRSELWQAWHFLQVYANWGIRLPTSETDFKAIMGADALKFDFLPPMQDGNSLISKACEAFLKNVFSEVIQVGMDLKVYAETTAGGEDGMLQIILDLVEDGDTETALELLTDLQKDAISASTRAGHVKVALDEFRTELGKALGKLDTARTSLDSDSSTNEETLGILAADANTEGSIAYKHKMLEEARRLHTEATIAAATSPTYIWVLPPLGLIATGVVMGIYTDKAIQRMKDIEELEDSIQKEGAHLKQALAARSVFTQGSNGLTNVISYTEAASAKCGVVQETWKGIASHISEMTKYLENTTRQSPDGEIEVKSKRLLGVALRKVEKNWQTMLPDLSELMTDNYVSIAPGTATVAEVFKKLNG